VLVSHAQHEIVKCGSGGLPREGKHMLKKFRDFAMKGNVVDLAIAVIIGAAFGKIVDSMVGDIIMPVIGAITGGLDFSNYFTALSHVQNPAPTLVEAKKQGAVMAWGSFLTVTFNFIVIAFALFWVVNIMQKLKKKEETAAPAEPPRQEVLLQEIRDLLAKR
jgi:large conductance mechanosensitive channel